MLRFTQFLNEAKEELHPIGSRVQRSTKYWKDTPEMRPHNFGTILSHVDGQDNRGKPMKGYMVQSDDHAATLKRLGPEPKPDEPLEDKWDRRDAQKGVFYGHKELMLVSKPKIQEGLATSLWTGTKRQDIADFTKRKKDVMPTANDTQPSRGEDLNPISKLMLNKGTG